MKKQYFVLSLLLALAVAVQTSIAQTATTTQGDQSKSAAQSADESTKNAAKSAGSATKHGTVALSDKIRDKIDINSASKDDLMKLEGVGDVTADKIIAGRPYKTKTELLNRKIVNKATYAKISDKLVAHAPKKPSAAK